MPSEVLKHYYLKIIPVVTDKHKLLTESQVHKSCKKW